MFGYACDDTPELMPLPITAGPPARPAARRVRKSGQVPYLRPDGKTQVTIEYDGNRAVRLDTVVVSTQHARDIDLDTLLTPDVRAEVVDPVLATLDIPTDGYRLLVNPTGRFEIGGPMGDAGLTGRKIIIDTYGGMARHGGGAFPVRMRRRSTVPCLRNAIGRKKRRCGAVRRPIRSSVAYAIGKARPVAILIESFGTGRVPDEQILRRDSTSIFGRRPSLETST